MTRPQRRGPSACGIDIDVDARSMSIYAVVHVDIMSCRPLFVFPIAPTLSFAQTSTVPGSAKFQIKLSVVSPPFILTNATIRPIKLFKETACPRQHVVRGAQYGYAL